MDLSRKTKLLFLIGLVLLNIFVRFPAEGDFREHRVDTFNLHAMSESVEIENEAKWVAHPLSVFGLYPYSYPSLPVFLVAAIAMLSGLSIEISVFVLAQIVGLLGICAGYVLGSELRDDFKYRFLMAAVISLAPILAYETIWTIPKRSIFMLEFCLLFWLLLRYRHTDHDKRYLVLMAPVLMAMLATHRMALLIPAFFGAYVLTIVLLHLWRRVHLVFHAHWKRELLKWAGVMAWAAAIAAFLFLQAKRVWFYSDSQVWKYYTSGFFFDGISTSTIFLNAVVDYYTSISILAIVGILGLAALVRRPVSDALLLNVLTILAFAFGLMLGQYMVFIYTPLIAILVVEGFFEGLRLIPRFRPLAVPALLVMLVITACFSAFMIDHWKGIGATPGVGAIPSEDTYSAALYLKHQVPEGNSVSNDLAIAKRITAYGYRYCFPVYNVLLPVFDLIEIDDIKMQRLALTELTPNSDYLYLPVKAPEHAIVLLVYNGLGNPKAHDTLEQFDLRYGVVNNRMPNEMELYGNRKSSPFFKDINNKRIIIYRNDLITITTILNKNSFED